MSRRIETESLARFLHDRFALDFKPSWDELDEFEKEHSEFLDMANAIIADWLDSDDDA